MIEVPQIENEIVPDESPTTDGESNPSLKAETSDKVEQLVRQFEATKQRILKLERVVIGQAVLIAKLQGEL